MNIVIINPTTFGDLKPVSWYEQIYESRYINVFQVVSTDRHSIVKTLPFRQANISPPFQANIIPPFFKNPPFQAT